MKQKKKTEIEVYAIYGDIGSAKETLPAMRVLENQGIKVRHFVDNTLQSRAGMVLEKYAVKYESREPSKDDLPDVIVVGTSATAVGAQIIWTQFGKANNIPVIWVEDLWGCGERETVCLVSPDVLCTLDEIGAIIAKSVRPNIEIKIVGKTTFGELSQLFGKEANIKKSVRSDIGVSENDYLITFWSSGNSPKRTTIHVEAIIYMMQNLQKTNHRIILAPRLHPKLLDKTKSNLYKKIFNGDINAVDARDINSDKLTISSNINISDWGNTGAYISALFGIPPIMCLFPDDEKTRINNGYAEGLPPLISVNAGWAAKSREDLLKIAAEIIKREKACKRYIVEHSKVFSPLLAPGAENRIANIVIKYLNT